MRKMGEVLLIFVLWVALCYSGRLSAQQPCFQYYDPPTGLALKSVGIHFGTNSLAGIDASISIGKGIDLRPGVSFLDFSVRDYESNFGLSEYYVTIDMDVRQTNFSLLADLNVSQKGGFRIVTGVGYFLKNKISGKVQLRDNFQVNDVSVTPEEIGYARVALSYDSFWSPFFGFGFGKLMAKKRMGFSFDVGGYFKGRPNIEIDGTGILRGNHETGQELTRKLSNIRWLPVVQFRLAYRIWDYDKTLQTEMH